MELFRLFGTIALKGTNEVENELKDVTKTAESSSNKMESAFKKIGTAVISYFAIDKIKDFGVAMVQASANIQAENAQFEASFGDLSDSATSMFNRVSEATGVFATRLQVTGTKAFSQMKGAGMEANEALQQTETFLNLASDASAYYDISLEDAEARIRSFMRGNVEAGDAIGLFTSESQRNTYALEMYGRKWIELTEAEKQNLMLNVAQDIYTQSGALGQAQREADGLANVSGNLKEVWRQFLGVIGQPVLQAVIPIMQNLTEKLKGLKGWVENNKGAFEAIGDVIGKVVSIVWSLVDGIISVIGWFKEHEAITNALISILQVLIATYIAFKAGAMIQGIITSWQSAKLALSLYSLEMNGASIAQGVFNGALTLGQTLVGLLTGKITLAQLATALWTKVQNGLNIALNANPIGLIITAIGALIAIIVVLYTKCDWYRNAVNKMFDGIKKVVQSTINFVKNNWKTIGLFLINPFAGAFKLLYDKCDKFRTFINNMVQSIKNAFSSIGTFFSNLWRNIKASFKLPHFTVSGSMNPAQWFKGNTPKIGVEWYAKGGIMNSPTLFGLNPNTGNAMVGGEKEPEAITPISVLENYVSKAVKQETNNLSSSVDRLYNLINNYLPQILSNMDRDIVLDNGALVGGIIKQVDKGLGIRSNSKARGNV